MKTKQKRSIGIIFILSLSVFFSGCGKKSQSQEELTLFVAASLTNVITEITEKYSEKTGVKFKINLASSGTLARQLNEGAECDVFFSASKKWLDFVQEKNLILGESVYSPVKNSLVLIVPNDSKISEISDFSKLPELVDGKFSIGDPEHVPAGTYAVDALKSLKIYDALEKSFLPAKDVRSAMMVVELGEAPFGIVYKTDALESKKVKIVSTFPESSHKPIVYFAAGLISSAKGEMVKEFNNFVMSEEAKKIWESYGFNTK